MELHDLPITNYNRVILYRALTNYRKAEYENDPEVSVSAHAGAGVPADAEPIKVKRNQQDEASNSHNPVFLRQSCEIEFCRRFC